MLRRAGIVVALALSGCATSTVSRPARSPDPGPAPKVCHARGEGVWELPDPACSPGAVNPDVTPSSARETICKPGWSASVRPPTSVTTPEKRVEARAYGYTGSLKDTELDHLIPLSIGGAVNDYRNYWLEPGASPNPKDELELVLHRRVCSGKMTLSAAQQAAAGDWVSAYHHYVGK